MTSRPAKHGSHRFTVCRVPVTPSESPSALNWNRFPSAPISRTGIGLVASDKINPIVLCKYGYVYSTFYSVRSLQKEACSEEIEAPMSSEDYVSEMIETTGMKEGARDYHRD